MSTFLQLLLRSLETGGIFALASLGIIIIYRTSNMTNFALGSIGMFNAFAVTVLYLKAGVPLGWATLIGMVIAFVVGIALDVVLIRHTKKASPVARQILTLGLIMIFLGIAPMFYGVDPLRLPQFIPTGSLSIAGANISYNGLFNIVLGLVIMLVLFYFLQKTKWGLAVRTTASNEYTARLMGVPTKTVTMGAWAVAAMLATLAGVMTAPFTSVTLNLMDNVQINALIACVFGGFQSFYGPVLAAYIIGISKNLLAFYVDSKWADQLLYIGILIFIVFRPYGLIGKKIVKKV